MWWGRGGGECYLLQVAMSLLVTMELPAYPVEVLKDGSEVGSYLLLHLPLHQEVPQDLTVGKVRLPW